MQLYGHLLPISSTMHRKETRHSGYRSEVMFFYERASVGPTSKYMQHCADIGCCREGQLVGWLDFMAYHPFQSFNTKSIFLKIVLFQTIQFSLSMQFKCKYSLIVKKFLFQAVQFSQAVLIQTIQFSVSTYFVYTHS